MSKELDRKRVGSSFLDQVKSKIVESYTPEKIEKKVSEMWDAHDIRVTKDGSEYRTPNWKAQESALKTVLLMYGIEGEGDSVKRAAPTNITIVVNGQEAVVKKQEVVEAKEIKANEANHSD